MCKYLRSLVTRKNEDCSILRREFESFVNPRTPVALSLRRARLFRYMQDMVVYNKLASVKADGLESVFYARYFVLRQFAVERADSKLREFMSASPKPGQDFKTIADEVIANAMRMEVESLRKRDSFGDAVGLYLKNEEMTKALFEHEAAMLHKILTDENATLIRASFESLNGETMSYVQMKLKPDIRNMSKIGDRVFPFS